MKLKNRCECFLIIFFLLIVVSGIGCRKKDTSNQNLKKIALLQYGSHPVIDQVVKGFRDSIHTAYKDSLKVQYLNASFDMQTAGQLSRQAVSESFDLFVSVTTPATGQMIGADRGKIPLVFTFVSNPPDIGYTTQGSLKNVTGLSDQVDYESSLKLIRSLMPAAKNIGYLVTRSEANALAVLAGFEKAAPSFNFEIRKAEVNDPGDVRIAASALLPHVDLFLFGGDNNVETAISVLISVARSKNLPTFACDEQSIERGAVAGYSVNYYDMGVKTASVAAKVLTGTSPENITVVLYKSSRLILNKKAAAQVGITFPDSLSHLAQRIFN